MQNPPNIIMTQKIHSHPRWVSAATLNPNTSRQIYFVSSWNACTYNPPTRGPNAGYRIIKVKTCLSNRWSRRTPKKTQPPKRLIAYPRPWAFQMSARIPGKKWLLKEVKTYHAVYTSADNKRCNSKYTGEETKGKNSAEIHCFSLAEKKDGVHGHGQHWDITTPIYLWTWTPKYWLWNDLCK